MADAQISRKARDFDIVITTATAAATTLDMRDVAGAVVQFGTMSTNATTLQMFVSNQATGTYARLCKADGSVADLTLSPSTSLGRAYALPDEVFAAEFLKVVGGTTHSSGVTGFVMLKS